MRLIVSDCGALLIAKGSSSATAAESFVALKRCRAPAFMKISTFVQKPESYLPYGLEAR